MNEDNEVELIIGINKLLESCSDKRTIIRILNYFWDKFIEHPRHEESKPEETK